MKNLASRWQTASLWKLTLAAALLVFPALAAGSNYLILVAGLIMIYIIAVTGLDIVFGYCGQISLGHAAFYAIGAYGSALMHQYLGLPIPLTMLLAAVLAAAIGGLIAYPASKLVFHFLSLSTVAFGEIVYLLLTRSPGNITGNFQGLFSQSVSFFGYEINTATRFYFFALICTSLFLLAKTSLVRSRIGRAFLAIRENTHAADGMGINVRQYKVIAFMTSAFFTAFAGAMYIHFVKYVHPDTFTQRQSVLFLTMLLFGGTSSLMGPIIGSATVMLFMEMLRSAQDYQMFIYGVLLLIVIVLMPGGLYKALQILVRDLLGTLRRRKGVRVHADD